MAKVNITFVEQLVREIEIDGREVVIRTADMEQILAMASYTQGFTAELQQAPPIVAIAIDGGKLMDSEEAELYAWLLGLVARHSEAVKQLVAISARIEPEFVGTLLPDRYVALLLLTLEVNADFFSRALPLLADLRGQLLLPGRGTKPAPATTSASTGPTPSSS